MQALYGHFIAVDEKVAKSESEMLLSIERFYDLFVYQLYLLSGIFQEAADYREKLESRKSASEKDRHIILLFSENRFLKELSESNFLTKLIHDRKISWPADLKITEKVFVNFRKGREYLEETVVGKSGFESDKAIVVALIRKYISDFQPLVQFYEERSIFWVDDIDIVNYILVKIIKSANENNVEKTFKNAEWEIDKEDKEFAINLLRKTVLNDRKFEEIISKKTLNWEVERLALVDIILMKMAICELLEFSSIPVKVTLNEYIELSKMYSTPKSSVFINGILDKLIVDFNVSGLIQKKGRGLME
jgi:transcription antitermination protein NusB